jgi:hypothetical protein
VTETTGWTTSTVGRTCRSQKYPKVNGKCSISSQCAAMQAVPSADCGPSQSCCYASSVDITPPTVCVPDNNPTITKGACVEGSEINSVCNGKEMSTSDGCLLGQFCCYTIPGGDGYVDVTTTGRTTLTTGSSLVLTTPVYLASTRPSTSTVLTSSGQTSTTPSTTGQLKNQIYFSNLSTAI